MREVQVGDGVVGAAHLSLNVAGLVELGVALKVDGLVAKDGSSKVARVPEPALRLRTTISASSPPTSFQLVIWPEKMPLSCSRDRSSTFTFLETTGPMPTTATSWSTRFLTWSASSLVSAKTSELPMVTVPAATAVRPLPEPLPEPETETSGLASMNFSAAASTRAWNEEAPS